MIEAKTEGAGSGAVGRCRRLRIAREGYPFVVGAAALAVAAYAVGWRWPALLLGAASLALAGFFRDPERIPPQGDEDLVVSPADGRVVSIREEGEGVRVSVFLSPLDVHVNRAPVSGRVRERSYRPGKFLAAYRPRASSENEQNALSIEDGRGRKLGVVQIAGFLARRIVCYVRDGDSLRIGQRFGMIMFGSRVDVLLPRGSRVAVTEGQKVRAGETILGRLP